MISSAQLLPAQLECDAVAGRDFEVDGTIASIRINLSEKGIKLN